MNYYDETISQGHVPLEPSPDIEPEKPGNSYYWDRRAEGHAHVLACRLAARDMGSAFASLVAVRR